MRRMSKTQTSHEPSPDEIAHGADDHGLHHPGDLAGEAHGPDDHGDGHGHDDHAHDVDALGPVDVQAWGALLLGVAAGLVIVLGLVLTTSILA
jgi:ABC-type nickel/cobalt efflux system permease component RcnA